MPELEVGGAEEHLGLERAGPLRAARDRACGGETEPGRQVAREEAPAAACRPGEPRLVRRPATRRRKRRLGRQRERRCERGVQQRCDAGAAGGHQVQVVGLEPVAVALGVGVPVDEVELGVGEHLLDEHLVHCREVGLRDVQRRPDDAGHPARRELPDRLLDARAERGGYVVVAHLDNDSRAKVGEGGQQIQEGRRRRALEDAARAGETTAHRDLHVEVDVPVEDGDVLRMPEHRRQHRVADHRHPGLGGRGGGSGDESRGGEEH